MVVDDEHDVVTLIKFLLEKDGHRVTEAYDGAEALQKLGVEPRNDGVAACDLILMDVMMPVMDGVSLSIRLAQDSRTRSVPVLVLTGRGETRGLFEAPNVAAYIEKPFDPEKLRETIAGMLPPSPAR